MTFLGDDWRMGADGLRFRHASRVLLFDPDGRLLLAQGHDLDNPTRHWWFTIGGGRGEHETPQEAALRELREETGIHLAPGALAGPVITRSAIFDFASETVRQYENFFAAWLTQRPALDTTGWSGLEKQMIDDFRWWSVPELRRTAEQVYPQGLGDLAAALVDGWDGNVVHLGDVLDSK